MSDSEGEISCGFDAALPEGIQKEIVKKGDTNCLRKPKDGDEPTVHYVGTFENGEQFDSSRDRGAPVNFPLGKGQVIKGWDLGIKTMIKGEIAKFTFQPEYAYGENGQPPTIPPNSVLIFEVELISWISKDDLFDDGGAIKSVVVQGDSWSTVKTGDEILLRLKAVAEDGRVIEDRPEFDYVVGSGVLSSDLAVVVDKCLAEMGKGSQVSIACLKDYVYKGKKYGDVTIELDVKEVYNTSDASVLKDGTVMRKMLKDGEGHATPEDMYEVHLRVESATDGEKPLPGFKPATINFRCGNGDVADVFEGVAPAMKQGERAQVTCTAAWKCQEERLGLSKVDAARVVFMVEMIGFAKGPEQWRLTDQDKMDLAGMRKETATKLFKAKRFELAMAKYKKVLETIGSHDSFGNTLKAEAIEFKRVVELNKAAVYLQLNDPTNALASCNVVLREDRNNVKAIFRRAKSHHLRNENVEAERDLLRVLELDPKSTEAAGMLPAVRKAQRLHDKESRNTFAKMCEGFGKIGSGREVKKAEPKFEPTPREPEPNPDIVQVSFKIEYKEKEGETMHIVGAPEQVGAWDVGRSLVMRKLPQPFIPPVGSGRAPPEFHFWEIVLDLPEELGRFEYRYVIKGGPKGDHEETGTTHKCDLTNMGGSRTKLTDSWRGEMP